MDSTISWDLAEYLKWIAAGCAVNTTVQRLSIVGIKELTSSIANLVNFIRIFVDSNTIPNSNKYIKK